MTNSIDRQTILDNLTAIETTAKLLVNAFVKKNNDKELYLNGIHREELIRETTIFLDEAHKLILNLSNTLNITPDGLLDKSSKEKSIEIKEQSSIISSTSDSSKTNENDKTNLKKYYSPSTVTLEDIIEHRLKPKDIFPNYPLIRDTSQPNLVSLLQNFRQIEDFNEFILTIYSKIFNHEERNCFNYHGNQGKLSYPKHKRLLFDLFIRLLFYERNKTNITDTEQEQLYQYCEKHCPENSSAIESNNLHIDQIDQTLNEKESICSIFQQVLPSDDVKKIVLAKKDFTTEWNDNQLCIYNARPIYLLFIKEKCLERYPLKENNENEKWSQWVDWAIEYFLDNMKIRPSKRKTKDATTDHKRTKIALTFEEKCQNINRTKFDVFEYGNQILQIISVENNKDLPTFEQLKLLEYYLFRFYWTLNQEKTWSNVLDEIKNKFTRETNENFRQFYFEKLIETNQNDQTEIQRLLQITS